MIAVRTPLQGTVISIAVAVGDPPITVAGQLPAGLRIDFDRR